MGEMDAMPALVAKRSLLRIVAMGLSAPVFLVMPPATMRVLRRGETVGHTWNRVGRHLTQSLAGERRNDRQAG